MYVSQEIYGEFILIQCILILYSHFAKIVLVGFFKNKHVKQNGVLALVPRN